MQQEKQPKKSKISLTKKLLFSIFISVVVLLVVTVLLSILERKKIIDTRRLDDIVTDPESKEDILKIIDEPDGEYYKVGYPEMVPDKMPVIKKDRTIRVFLYGGSFVMGSPYPHFRDDNTGPGTIPMWLEAILQAMYPDVNFEVCNLGAGCWSSTSVFSALKNSIKAEPDLAIVISGNNEGFVINSPFNKALQKWVIYRALKKKIKPDPDLAKRPLYIPQDPDYRKIEKQYRHNIEQIINICQERDIRLMLGTVPINYLYTGPQKLREGPDGLIYHYHESDRHIDVANELFKQGKFKSAIKEAGKSKTTPLAIRLIAGALISQQDYKGAREVLRAFVQMRPQGRTRPVYNEFIRDITRERNVHLVDLEKYFEENSLIGIPDPHLFVDHCHMTWWGYKMVADRLATAITETGFIPKDAKQNPYPTIEKMVTDNRWEELYRYPISQVPIILDEAKY